MKVFLSAVDTTLPVVLNSSVYVHINNDRHVYSYHREGMGIGYVFDIQKNGLLRFKENAFGRLKITSYIFVIFKG